MTPDEEWARLLRFRLFRNTDTGQIHYQPTEGELGAWSVRRIFNQDRLWRDNEGTVWELAKMRPRHLRNLLAFLERRASYLAMTCVDGMFVSPIPITGEMACDDMERAYEESLEEAMVDPLGYLRQTPLMKEIKRLVDADANTTNDHWYEEVAI